MTLKKNIPYYLITLALFLLLKLGHAFALTNNLIFILKPTNMLTSMLTGQPSFYVQNKGYYYPQDDIIIDKYCSGVNFWLLCFAMLAFLCLKYFHKAYQKLLVILFSCIGAYLLTIFVNSSRIFASIVMKRQDVPFISQNQEVIHEAVGVLTNLAFLVLTYIAVERFFTKRQQNAKVA